MTFAPLIAARGPRADSLRERERERAHESATDSPLVCDACASEGSSRGTGSISRSQERELSVFAGETVTLSGCCRLQSLSLRIRLPTSLLSVFPHTHLPAAAERVFVPRPPSLLLPLLPLQSLEIEGNISSSFPLSQNELLNCSRLHPDDCLHDSCLSGR